MIHLVLAALLFMQDPPPPVPAPSPAPTPTPAPEKSKYKVDAKLTIDADGGQWRFVVEGTTDLPNKTLLRGRLVILEQIEIPRPRIDEDSFEEQRAKNFEVKDGKFREVLATVQRKPYTLWYRTKIDFDPENQEEEVANRVVPGDLPKDIHADLPPNPAALEKELAETTKELNKEMAVILEMFRGLKKKMQEWIKEPDPKAFRVWAQGFRSRIDEVDDRNKTRYSLWAVWLERQGKFRIDGMVERFRLICNMFEAWLAKKDPEALARVHKDLDSFIPVYEEAREVMGIDTPFDPETVGAIVHEFEATVAELGTLAEKKDAAAWAQKAPELRVQARSALLKLVAQKLIPRRGYDRVLAVTGRFIELYTLQEKIAGGAADEASKLEEAVKLQKESLADFKLYAGLK